ncbi:MAG: hypothetical protein KDA50_14495, partial [Rhodobacteraceae bacterium]|nr:hypothetical protein [Paracoccaceae bacterium]
SAICQHDLKGGNVFEPTFCEYVRNQKRIGLTSKTSKFVLSELARRGGFNARDKSIIADPNADIGTGMSLRGLQCAFGADVTIVSRGFYGRQHHWQVRLYDDYYSSINFAYLEGDGSKLGMVVTGWN